MSDPVLKLQILARSELALAQIRLERTARRSALFVVAMIFALLGLSMLSYAIFYAVSQSHGPIFAALIVALIDVSIAIIVLLIARRAGGWENDEKLALEMRDLASTELNSDIEHIKDEVARITDDVRSVTDSVSAFSGAATNTIVPLLGMLAKAIKK